MLKEIIKGDDMEQVSNNTLSRVFSLEMVGSLLATAFLVGMTWNSLAKDVKDTDGKVGRVEQKHIELETNVQSIRIDMAVVKTNQEHIKRDFETQGEKLKEQGEDIKKILQILQYNKVPNQ